MSGGRFDYEQYRINTIADSILEIIRQNEDGYEDYPEGVFYEYSDEGKMKEKPEGWQRYTDEAIEKIKEGYRMCRVASAYAQRIDWLVSGDDDEGSFFSRLKDELEKIELEIKKLDERNWNIGKRKEDIEEL